MNGEQAKEALKIICTMNARKQSVQNKQDLEILAEILTPMLEKWIKRADDRERGYLSDVGEFDPEKEALKLYGAIAKFHSEYPELEKQLEYFQREYNDLNHAIELLGDEDEEELLSYAKQLKRHRKDRRIVKDTLEAAEPLHRLFHKYAILQQEAQKALVEVREIMERQKRRTYTPREMTSLQAAFEKASKKQEDFK